MFDGEKHAGHDRDRRVKEKERRELIAKEQTGRDGRKDRLDVENDVHDGRIPILEREGEENRADRRTREGGERKIAPGAPIDLRNFPQPNDEERQEHEKNENVFPENNDPGIKEIVQRDAPGALRPPERGSERHQPGTMAFPMRRCLRHARRVYRPREDASTIGRPGHFPEFLSG